MGGTAILCHIRSLFTLYFFPSKHPLSKNIYMTNQFYSHFTSSIQISSIKVYLTLISFLLYFYSTLAIRTGKGFRRGKIIFFKLPVGIVQ